MGKYINRIIDKYKKTGEKALLVYFALRILVIICMILQILRGDWNNAFLCILSLILFTIPSLIEEKLKIDIPTVLEATIYLFIFAAEILGEINNFYGIIPHWDSILHTINGFLAAGIGFSLIDLLNQSSKSINLSPIFVAIVAFCFSMTIGVAWEFFEYGVDRYLKFDMQKDVIVSNFSSVELDPDKSNKAIQVKDIDKTIITLSDGTEVVIDGGYLDIGLNDTMKDLIVNFIGAFIFSCIGFLYIQNRDKYKFATHFIPRREKNEK